MIVLHRGCSYRVTGETVEVFMPAPVSLHPRASYWRKLNPFGKKALQVRIIADNIKRKKEQQ